MTDLRKAAEMVAYEAPLHELLEGVPEDARLVIEDGYGARFIPVGRMCKEAAEALRQALAAGRIRARSEKPPVKSYCGGKPNYCTPEVTPEVTGEVTGEVGACVTCGAPKSEWLVDAVNISAERVDETAKSKHEPWPSVQCACGGTIYFKHTKREWVGIDEKEISWLWFWMGNREKINGYDFAKAIESKLKERNNG